MATTNNFTNIHIRDFVQEIQHDPTRPGYDGALQLHSNLNIPPVQGEELSDDIDIVGIPALIRIFTGIGSRDRYKPNVFVYATGSFNVNTSPDGLPLIVITTFASDCHPGDPAKDPLYYKRCPGEAPPTLTFQGIRPKPNSPSALT
ncbi:hypothetical protein V8E54_002702 [Elaphomyces granulatus]